MGSSSLQRGNVTEFYGVLRRNPRGVHTQASMTHALKLRDIEGLGGTEVYGRVVVCSMTMSFGSVVVQGGSLCDVG